ncbi:MAG: hypothetical protein INR73_18730 [Williamsia sp.]|nr:hypothetical protein [Williamsia sp.]
MANQYVFLPWLRRGLAQQIADPDPLTAQPHPDARPTIQAGIRIIADDAERATVNQPFSLLGPGDITGISTSAIVKTDPGAGTKNFEPNYFPYIEFYEEDFLWRYSPAKAAGDRRLRPWLTLIVLEEKEFERQPQNGGPGNKVIRILAAPLSRVFPPASQLWATAHVQINDGSLLKSELADPAARNLRLAASLKANPNLGVCRLFCPRKLKQATTYWAFLIPSFEKGRVAGLGGKKSEIEAVGRYQVSWEGSAAGADRFPVYYEWSFQTGSEGFEQLAKKIVPRDLSGTDTGKLWMDASDINYGDLFDYNGSLHPGNKPGLLPFEGALRLIGAATPNLTQRTGPAERGFVDQFSKLLNLGIDYRRRPRAELQERIPLPGNDEDDPLIVPPIYGRWYVKGDGTATVKCQLPDTWLDQLNLDPAMRVAAGLGAAAVKENQEEYMSRAWEQLSDYRRRLNRDLHRLNFAQEITKALFQKHFVQGTDMTGDSANKILALTHSIQPLVKSDQPNISIAGKLAASKTDAAFVQPGYRRITRANGPVMKRVKLANTLTRAVMSGQTQFFVIGLAALADLAFQNFGSSQLGAVDATRFLYQPGPWPNVALALQNANWYGDNFGYFLTDRAKLPLIVKDLQDKVLNKPLLTMPPQFQLSTFSEKILKKITPEFSFQLQYKAVIPADAPPAVAQSDVISPNSFNPAFTDPAYEKLARLKPELFIPNLDRIEPESFVLLQANAPFIEAYLAGMNHEMGAEFVWRGYPADLNATYFRQFWDTSDAAPSGTDRSDIKPIRTWPLSESLGKNAPAGVFPNPLVFVIRAELITKYPNLVVYAQKARLDANGIRIPDPAVPVKAPIFLSGLQGDFLMAGFELTREEALGIPVAGTPGGGSWYFVIAERPGEMHFGLDQSRPPGGMATWNDLAWTDLPAGVDYLDLEKHIPPQPAVNDGLQWGKGQAVVTADPAAGTGDAAQMAAILQQRPVQIFIHASLLVK